MQNAKYLRAMKICSAGDADHTHAERLEIRVNYPDAGRIHILVHFYLNS